ncbi:MAG: hypothetical protein HC904_02355 [Blastochloris sp.]|nr:hypothetical protein [Blastochloris sp.]
MTDRRRTPWIIFWSEAGKRGFKVWAWSTNRVGKVTAADVGIVKDEATAKAWAEAVASVKDGMEIRNNPARIWDPRLEVLGLERMKAIVMHTNKHRGLRWADDPTFAVWELSNEEWWMRKMLAGSWKKLPAFFQEQLEQRWSAWVRKKYGEEGKLKASWGGVLAEESWERGRFRLAPMGKNDPKAALNDANEAARQAVAGTGQGATEESLADARASDVLEFLLELQLAHKKRSVEAFKSWGRSTRLSPVLYDTGIGYETHSQYMHQQAEAVSHDAYVNGWGIAQVKEAEDEKLPEHLRKREELSRERRVMNAGPWINWLLLPPGISQGVPWLEHNKVEGKPFLVYETQIQQPAKYRVDFPLRLAALAAIQDWDWINWHYFATPDDVGRNERAFDKPMDVTTGSHPQGYHYTYDEVQTAMMRAAGFMFRQKAFAPAARPTQFIYGRKSLYSPESMVFHGSYGTRGHDMLPTTYQYGVRIKIDAEREEDEVIGPVVRFEDRWKQNPYQATEEIEFDWKKGF